MTTHRNDLGMKHVLAFCCTLTLTGLIAQSGITVSPRVFLGGPYDSGTLLMSDALRVQGLLPLQEPYSALGFAMLGGGGVSTNTSVLSATGNNAIVDWVLVELRHATDHGWVIASRCALVQRDGDVVATNGSSPVSFGLPAGDYYVAVRHRNHLGVITANTVALGAAPSLVDLTLPGTAVFGTNARKNVEGTMVLWPGDANMDGEVKYVGSGNDRDAILSAIGGVIPTNVLSNVYTSEDVNMDGLVKYVGLNNDRDVVLQTIGGTVPTATLDQQVPAGPYAYSVPEPGVTDIDGNSYPTIIFGNGQEWMAENLRTANYANGDPVPNYTGSMQWYGADAGSIGAWANYANDGQNDLPFGKLYNWYAVTDPRNVCPLGWHVPGFEEWESWIGYCGGSIGLGGKMKVPGTQYWTSPNTGAGNETGFSGMPGGFRYGEDGSFSGLGIHGFFWSATESPGDWAFYYSLSHNSALLDGYTIDQRTGCSVRCIRD